MPDERPPGGKWDPFTKAEALELYVEHGPSEASRRIGVPLGTIETWAKLEGLQTIAATTKTAATGVLLAEFDRRKAALAAELMADAEQMRQTLWSPALVHHWDKNGGYHEHQQDAPSYSDRWKITTAIEVAVKTAQLLAGQATARVEHIGGDEEIDKAAVLVDELLAARNKRQAIDTTATETGT